MISKLLITAHSIQVFSLREYFSVRIFPLLGQYRFVLQSQICESQDLDFSGMKVLVGSRDMIETAIHYMPWLFDIVALETFVVFAGCCSLPVSELKS
jgi:hypothetical protein